MTAEKQRIAIATACGWTRFNCANHNGAILYGQPPNARSNSWELSKYPSDLNAMHEAEKVLSTAQLQREYADILDDGNGGHFATASERSEAFLRTLGLWEEEANTTKSVSPTSPVTEQADNETAEQKLAWLTILLVTKSCDPVFTDHWLRLARRNLRLGLPLMTPEPELNPATEESSATDHFRDATKMVSGDSSAAVKESLTTQPQSISTAPQGQRILLYCQRKIESEGWWQIGMHCPDVHRWIDDDYEPDWMLVQPTYWLPLPAHPTQPNP